MTTFLRRDCLLLVLSAAGLPLTRLAIARLSRTGGLLVEGMSLLLFARVVQLIASGTVAALRTFPRRLAYAEAAVDSLALVTGFWIWVWQPFRSHRKRRSRAACVTRLNTLAVAVMFIVHTVRYAIYLSAGHGRRNNAADSPREIAQGVYWLRVRGANVYFVRSGSSWVLIDAAWANCGATIREASAVLFGASAPAAIVLTHFHPDHCGSAAELAHVWGCPVYLHPDEMPIAVGADLSIFERYQNPLDRWIILPLLRLMPRRRVESVVSRSSLAGIAQAFDPRVAPPGLPDWSCIPTPGHSPGHVAFFREADRVLLTGDACLTADFDSFRGVLPHVPAPSPPPYISSWSWPDSKASVARLAHLEPRVLATGHGTPMTGEAVAGELHQFAERFAERPRDQNHSSRGVEAALFAATPFRPG